MDKEKFVIIKGKYAEELRNAIRHKYDGDRTNTKDKIEPMTSGLGKPLIE